MNYPTDYNFFWDYASTVCVKVTVFASAGGTSCVVRSTTTWQQVVGLMRGQTIEYSSLVL
ncbi:hypothetical protein EMIT019CA3_10328 [Bacillus pseudomycoides]